MRPLEAFALPARTALSVVNASSGRSLSRMRCAAMPCTQRLGREAHAAGAARPAGTSKFLAAAGLSPSLAMRMAPASAVLMRGLAENLAGRAARQVGQDFLPWATHLLKQPRQKLWPQGACAGAPRERRRARARPLGRGRAPGAP